MATDIETYPPPKTKSTKCQLINKDNEMDSVLELKREWSEIQESQLFNVSILINKFLHRLKIFENSTQFQLSTKVSESAAGFVRFNETKRAAHSLSWFAAWISCERWKFKIFRDYSLKTKIKMANLRPIEMRKWWEIYVLMTFEIFSGSKVCSAQSYASN